MTYIKNKKTWITTNPDKNKKKENKKISKTIWITAILASIISITASMYFTIFNKNNNIMTILVFINLFLIIIIAKHTKKGKNIWDFMVEAKNEIKIIKWPNKKEIITLTGIILITICIASILIYFIGLLYIYIIKYILNY